MVLKLRRWQALPPEERGVVLRAAGLLVLLDLASRVRPLARLRTQAAPVPAPLPSPERIGELVAMTAAVHPWRTRCLARALTLHRLLSERGIAAELRLGARRGDGGRTEAHAWVEVEGRPVGEAPGAVERFTPLLPAAPEQRAGF